MPQKLDKRRAAYGLHQAAAGKPRCAKQVFKDGMYEQCAHSAKEGSEFCGTHLNRAIKRNARPTAGQIPGLALVEARTITITCDCCGNTQKVDIEPVFTHG